MSLTARINTYYQLIVECCCTDNNTFTTIAKISWKSIDVNIHSIMEALGRVVKPITPLIIVLRCLFDQISKFDVKHLLFSGTNFHTASIKNINAFKIPSIHETLLPNQVGSNFDLQLYQFGKSIINKTVDKSTYISKDILLDRKLMILCFSWSREWPGRECDTDHLCNSEPEFDDRTFHVNIPG